MSEVADENENKGEDETEKDFIKRKREYGSKLLENRSLSLKTQAGKVLGDLKSAVEAENLQRREEEQLSSKIDEYFSKMPRKVTLELGSENNRKLDPIEYEVTQADLDEVRDTLKDPEKRNNFLFNKEGLINIENIANVLARNKYLESLVKTAYLTGEDRQSEVVKRTFGARRASDIGIGGIPDKVGSKGSPVSAGKPQRVAPSYSR